MLDVVIHFTILEEWSKSCVSLYFTMLNKFYMSINTCGGDVDDGNVHVAHLAEEGAVALEP